MFYWGIIGLGRIAHKFAHELKQTGLGEIGAVASRDLDKATDFAEQYGARHAYGSYDELIENAHVDAIYVSVPHHLHAAISIKCLEKRIPVLCEKPFTINRDELQTVVNTARSNQVFLMEAMWSRFMPHIAWIKEEFDKGTFGKIMHLKAEFCFKGKERGLKQGVNRLIENELGGGALLDIGIYPVFLSHLFLGNPETIHATASIQNDIDETCQIILGYSGGVHSILDTSILWESDGRAELYFEYATIIIPHRWHESNEIVIKKEGSQQDIKKWNYPSRGFYYEMKEVQDCLSKGKKESPLMALDFSLTMMDTLDKIRAIIGLKYPADK